MTNLSVSLKVTCCCVTLGLLFNSVAADTSNVQAEKSRVQTVWPGLAPGETSKEKGTPLPKREGEKRPVTRITKVRSPEMDVFLPEKPNGTAILILPGGGFRYVVPDLEGSEAAPWLNSLGVTVFVLRYRTNEITPDDEPAWRRPLQDAQRSLRVIRSRAETLKLDKNRIGVLGFSAGGQTASVLHTAGEAAAYEAIDEIDEQSCRPDFSLLVYPWRVMNEESGELLPEIKIDENSPPAFIVHTHDDGSTSVGAALIYIGLKKNNVPAELHIYENGGHGYGTRSKENSNIGTWPDRASDWLIRRGLAKGKASETATE